MTSTFIPRLAATALALSALATSGAALAQGYPTKPVTLVVPFAAGGPTDVVAHLLGATMAKSLGQTVVIENKTGAELGAVIVPEAKQTPAGLQTWLAEETARYAPVIKAAGQFAD